MSSAMTSSGWPRRHLLEHRQEILHRADLLVDQMTASEDDLHAVGVRPKQGDR
jgi:hypothetical protein